LTTHGLVGRGQAGPKAGRFSVAGLVCASKSRHGKEQNIDAAIVLRPTHSEDMAMDKDRIKGSAEQAKGAVKEAAGKISGDKKLESEGKADKVAGKVQNAIGGLKDTVRGK
jgi:uncharacterized protein YjbJ (UPF0337 family)